MRAKAAAQLPENTRGSVEQWGQTSTIGKTTHSKYVFPLKLVRIYKKRVGPVQEIIWITDHMRTGEALGPLQGRVPLEAAWFDIHRSALAVMDS